MSKNFRHKRYYRVRDNMGELITFVSTHDANQKINLKSEWNTCLPKVTDTLLEDNKVLCNTFEFESDADQVTFKLAIDNLWNTGKPWSGSEAGNVEYMKVEWLSDTGSVEFTKSFI